MQAKGVQKVAIIGLGLIGGSIGRSLIEQNFSKRIVGFDINRASLKEAVRCRAIHCEAFELEDAVDDADLVVLATPVGQVAETVLSVCDRLKSGAVITDVGSTKSFITSVLAESLRKDVFFVGGHPMTGSEQAGIEWADQYLFENAVSRAMSIALLTPKQNPALSAILISNVNPPYRIKQSCTYQIDNPFTVSPTFSSQPESVQSPNLSTDV
jgi:prephenate dehydrogenase